MASITLNMCLSGSVVTTDRPNEKAELGHNGQLILKMSTGWPAGVYISRVDFYHNASSCNGDSTVYWTPPNNSVGLANIYRMDGGNSNTPRQVTMTALETTTDDYWYRVSFSDGAILDPEVLNKSGDEDGAQWVSKAAAMEINVMPQGAKAPTTDT